MPIAPARVCAFTVIRRVFEEGAYADRALNAEAVGLDGRDRGLAMALAYGAVQRMRTLDHIAEQFTERPMDRLDPSAQAALRLGLIQLLFLDGIADHAAVNDSVALVKASQNPGGAGLVNAVLRRASREGRDVLAGLSDETPAHAAVKHSVPQWLAELWFDELGGDDARALLAVINDPAESAIRVNTLKRTVEDLLTALPISAHPAKEVPEGLVLDAAFDAFGSELFSSGAIMPQSRGSMLVARTLDPQPGERILDLCAAPGGKTTHLAALIGNDGRVDAVEVNPQRADGLRRTVARMGASSVTVLVADATEPLKDGALYDRVLVDPPCSGLGTLQSRPDIRWRTNLERLRSVSARQARILERAAAATRPGGTLVYSVCTISRAESAGVVEPFLAAQPEWTLEGTQLVRPDTDRTDGFWIALMRREQ